jgi:hypothetical protein
MSGLLPLQVLGQAICSRDGAGTELTVIDGLCEGVAVAPSIPQAFSSSFEGDEAPHWASEAAKGIFLDVSSRVNSSYCAVDIGEVCSYMCLLHAPSSKLACTSCPPVSDYLPPIVRASKVLSKSLA